MTKGRVVEVKGQIKDLTKQSKSIMEMSKQSRKPIYIVIDSNGGSVFAGIKFMNSISRVKARGVPVVCVVDGAAMSMAMHIFGACTAKYALKNSMLMTHQAYVAMMFAVINKDKARKLEKQLTLLTNSLEESLRESMKLTKKEFNELNDNEYIMLAGDVYNDIAPKFLNNIISDYYIEIKKREEIK